MIELSTTDRDDAVLTAFRSVAPAVYADDPVWAPASEGVIDECLARAQQGEIELRAIVATNGGRAVARAMGIRDTGGSAGRVGLFECLPGLETAGRAVLESSVQWLGSTGATSAIAPRVDELRAGLLIEGFDRPHTVFTAHNPPHYLDVFRSAGFVLRDRMVSFEFTRRRVPTFHHLPFGGITVRHPDQTRVDDELDQIEAFQNAVFGTRPDRVHRNRMASRSLARRLLPLLDLDLVVLAEDSTGEIVGALICLPDRWQPPPIDRARLVSIGVASGWRGKQVAMTMGAALVERLLAKGYQTLEGSWIMDDNTRPQALARALGGTPGRVFALLERAP